MCALTLVITIALLLIRLAHSLGPKNPHKFGDFQFFMQIGSGVSVCSAGGHSFSICGPVVWVPRWMGLVDRWLCRAEPLQVCCCCDRQHSEHCGDSWIGGQRACSPRQPLASHVGSYRCRCLFWNMAGTQGHPPHGVQEVKVCRTTCPRWWGVLGITSSQPAYLSGNLSPQG